MVEFMYTKDYDDDAEERGSKCVSESEDAGVGTLSQGKGYTYDLVQFIRSQTKTMIMLMMKTHPIFPHRHPLILSVQRRWR
jgi:hypothetical protein